MVLKPPPGLLGLTFFAWGWYLEMAPIGVAMGILVELSRLPNLSLEVNPKEVRRIVQLCLVISAFVAIYAIRNNTMDEAAFLFAKWVPVIWYLPLLVEYYGGEAASPYKAMIPKLYDGVIQPFHLGYPFFSMLLISAGSNIISAPSFYPLTAVLIAYAIYPLRGKHYPAWAWVVSFVGLTGVGYWSHSNLHRMQQEWSEEFVRKFQANMISGVDDPYRTNTAMGHIGSLKLSERILLRLQPDNPDAVPALLRTASYNRLRGDTWMSSDDEFLPVDNITFQTWAIQPAGQPGRSFRLVQNMRRGRGLLPLPLGSYRVDRLAIPDLTRHPMGAVRVEEGPELLDYDVDYDPLNETYSQPRETDLEVPGKVTPALEMVLKEMGATPDPKQLLPTMNQFFRSHFSYTLDLSDADNDLPPVSDFLLNIRRGHCEYFASATVLLLRQMNIPARYTVGYSVQEWSDLENAYLVRRRHSHAWCVAYINGRWIDVDNTPPDWNAFEVKKNSSFLGLYDVFSMLWTRFTLWRMQDRDDSQYRYLILLPLPLVLFFLWRRAQRTGRVKKKAPVEKIEWPGEDSECFKIIEALLNKALPRLPGETLAQWFARIRPAEEDASTALLSQILDLHYRYRFDPLGLDAEDRARLRKLVEQWLQTR